MSLLHANPVFVTTCQRAVFTAETRSFREHIIRAVCVVDVELAEFKGETELAHSLVHGPPMLAISTLVHRLKVRTAHTVWREYTGAWVRAWMRTPLIGVSTSPSPAESTAQWKREMTQPKDMSLRIPSNK